MGRGDAIRVGAHSTAPQTLAVCVGLRARGTLPTSPPRFPYECRAQALAFRLQPGGCSCIAVRWTGCVRTRLGSAHPDRWRMAHLRLDIHSDCVPTPSRGTAANERLAHGVRWSGSFWLAGRCAVRVHGGLQQPRDSVGRVRIPVRALSRDVALPYDALPGCHAHRARSPCWGKRHGASHRAGTARCISDIVVAAGWLFMLWDQMPCFLGGVPGCD